MKGLIKRGLYEKNDPDAVNLRESYGYVELFIFFGKSLFLFFQTFIAQAERFASSILRKQFTRIANKEVRHKL
jgi:peroxisomal 3,2-trans-enoyl-CoA isomerase